MTSTTYGDPPIRALWARGSLIQLVSEEPPAADVAAFDTSG